MSGEHSSSKLRNIIKSLEQGMEDARGLSKSLSGTGLMDRLMCAVLGAGGSPQRGHLAAKGILSQFVDWNEVRVSGPTSVSEAMAAAGLPDSAARARTATEFLGNLFRRYGSMGLQFLKDANPSDTKRFVTTVSGEDKVLNAAILLVAFGTPVVPPTPSLHRVCGRLGVCPPDASAAQCAKKVQSSLPAEMLLDSYNLLESLAERYCHPESPDCKRCPASAQCPSARKFLKAAEAGLASKCGSRTGGKIESRDAKARGADGARISRKERAVRAGKKK